MTKNNNYIFWIGIQESEIKHTNEIFKGSITIFGSGKNGNYAFDKKYGIRYDYNIDNDLWIAFVNAAACEIIQLYPDCKFMMYYPMDAVFYDRSVTDRIIGTNDPVFLDLWDNKFKCREWLGNDVPVVSTEVCYGENIESLWREKIHTMKNMIVQGEYSCGGSNTWLLTKDNMNTVFSKLNAEKIYAISNYLENSVSVNIHLVIYSDDILLLPASIQIIDKTKYFFEYRGADFITYRYLPKSIKDKVQQYSLIIGERLRRSNYLGVCGVDYIVTQNEVYFSEINPRFQSSTFILNMALHDNGLPFSVHRLHLDAFNNTKCQYSIPSITVDYSYYKNIYSHAYEPVLKNLASKAKSFNGVIYMDDDLFWEFKLEENTYLYKLIFKHNICSISPDFKLIIHPNLRVNSCIANFTDLDNQMLELKIMLLSHGITISPEAEARLQAENGINCEEFDAIDLVLNNKYYINVPYQTNLSQLSPFSYDIKNGVSGLYYCDQAIIAEAYIRGVDSISENITKGGISYSDIAYLGNDRLRVYHRLGCFFKQACCGCQFCDIESDNRMLAFETITEVIDAYDNCSDINHYLIGGGSQNSDDNFENICKIAEYLKTKNDKSIYLMSLPVNDRNILAKLKRSGITEIAFNIEIFDRNLAKKYMPGKGEIELQTYFDALKLAVELWGKTGNVRTIFIVGLEPKQSLLKGIEQVCKFGVSPILSLFKPIKGTKLNYMMPPPDEDILDIVAKAEKLCGLYGVELGPSCHYCEDNTLKITR